MGVRIRGGLGSPPVSSRIIFKRVSELAAGCVGTAAAHGVKLAVGWEKDARHAGSGIGMFGPAAQLQEVRCSGWCRRRAWASTACEIEFADARVPGAALGILVDMPEVHAIGGIDIRPRIITPADATVESDSRRTLRLLLAQGYLAGQRRDVRRTE